MRQIEGESFPVRPGSGEDDLVRSGASLLDVTLDAIHRDPQEPLRLEVLHDHLVGDLRGQLQREGHREGHR